jgi:hypothetical protein
MYKIESHWAEHHDVTCILSQYTTTIYYADVCKWYKDINPIIPRMWKWIFFDACSRASAHLIDIVFALCMINLSSICKPHPL